jgi:uncharacterized protein
MGEIVDDPTHHRLVLELDGSTAELVYQRRRDQLVIVHTEVPEELGGHGIGGRLVRAAVELAAASCLTIEPWCPFARKWLRDHPDVAAAVRVDWEAQTWGQRPGNADSSEPRT